MSETDAGMMQARSRLPRIDLLAAMGIVSWLPRRALPGAAAGPAWAQRGATDGVAAPAPARAAARDGGRALAEARRLIAEPEKSPVASPAPAPAPAAAQSAAPVAGAAEAVSLRFELLRLRPDLALLLQWPPAGPTTAERAFAGDLVYAMGVVPEALPAPLVLDWRGRAGTSGSLPDAVAGFLAALESGRLVALEPDPRARLADCLPATVRLLELPSIARMIAEPGRKADAWKRLAPFLAPERNGA